MPAREDVCDGREPVLVPFRGDSDAALDAPVTSGFVYDPVNRLPGGASDLLDEAEGCSCVGSCRDSDSCTCIETHGCFYETDRLLLDALPPQHALYECSEVCACSEECGNRITTRGVRLSLYVQSTNRGLGLFAGKTIARGSFVCLYAGEIISQSTATQRWRSRKDAGLGNYVLVLREESEGQAATLKTIIDPTERGNLGRFINHACPPLTNCIIQPVRPVGHLVPLAAVFAARGIEADGELSFDYAGGASRPSEDDPSQGGTICLCGSSQCRGWLPFDANL